jgi:hypothetical protein
MAFLSTRLRTVVGKIESTPGTPETLESADFNVRVYDPQITLGIEVDDEAAKDATGDHAEFESVIGAQTATVSFYVKANTSGTPATEPDWFKFAKGCGLVTKAYTTTGTALLPRQSGDVAPMTIWVLDKERGEASPVTTAYKLAGCMGNMVLTAEGIGKPLTARFTFTGKLVDIVDTTALVLTSPDTALPEKWLSSTTTVASVKQFASSWSLDLGNEVVPLYDQSEATGIAYYTIASRRPRFTINPLAVKQATTDVLNETLTAATGGLVVTTANFRLTAADMQRLPPSVADREGFVAWEQVYKLLRNHTGAALIDSALTAEDTFELIHGARA